MQKAEQLTSESLEPFKERYKDKLNDVNKKQIVGYFDLLYRAQFPGLDYKYFEKSAKEALQK